MDRSKPRVGFGQRFVRADDEEPTADEARGDAGQRRALSRRAGEFVREGA